MEYIPGWGDVLKQNLPALGSAIMDIVMPNKKAQLALQAEIQKDPTLLGKLATVAKDNPGALANAYGKDTEDFFSSLNETPEAQLNRQVTQSAANVATARPEDVGAAKLGIKDPTTAERGRIQLDRERQIATFVNQLPPDMLKTLDFKSTFGMTEPEVKKTLARADNMKAAEPLRDMSTKDFIAGWKAGRFTPEQIQGVLDLTPDVYKIWLNDEAFNREAGLRRELAHIAHQDNREQLMTNLFMQTAKDAGRIHVKPGALFEAQYGFAAPDVVPSLQTAYSNEDVKVAKEALQREERQERAKLLTPVLKSLDALNKQRNSGTIAAFNAAAQAADIDLRAEEQDKFGPNKTVFYWNGTQVKAEDLPTILDPDRTPSGTNKEEEIKVEPPATSSRTATGAKSASNVRAVTDKYKDMSSMVQSPEYAKLSDSEKAEAQQALATGVKPTNTKFKGDIRQFDQTQFDDADVSLRMMRGIVESNLSKDAVLKSPSFQSLSKKDQKIILDNLEF